MEPRSDSDSSGRLRRGLALVREALRGGKRDYTSGSIGRALLLLAVPMMVEMAMESLFAVVDIFWVAKLGAGEVAVVGTTEALLALVYALAMGLSMAAAATVARRVGEKQHEEASVAAVQSLWIGLAFALPLGILGGLFARELLLLVGAQAATVAQHGTFAVVMLGGNASILLLFLLNAVFRGAGDATIAMRTLWIANGINLLLDPCLIFGLGPFPALGVTGAAIATTTGRSIGVLYQLVQLSRGRGELAVARRHLRFDPGPFLSIVKRAGSGIVQSLIGTSSWLVLNHVANAFGDAAVAGYTIGMRVIVFGLLPSWGMANAAATMVGQSLGAKDATRAERAVWLAGRINLAILVVVGLVFIVGARPIVGCFSDDPAVVGFAGDALRTIAYGFGFYAFGMVLAQSFNGAGDPWTPTWINVACFWAFELPFAAWLSGREAGAGGVLRLADGHLCFGPGGIFWAVFAAFTLYTLLGAALFRRGKWKAKVV